ncbi:MAG: NADH-quinone oxidoreductase subunit M [Bacillati bacterium ANGP1]|uniref:NADH-quinone oxidoreductase subunit M n=1 Tax=Candidatus Segetimicrobium genomatis TaxID=2569760 RepID=A0A537JE22_9BACT|nr:MAG: NADH-quinone oxidoreductase subunit M [Terrabacteria group bacterium ANGP1]
MSAVLSLILWLPVAGAIALVFVPRDRLGTIRMLALATSLLTFGASIGAGLAFDRAHAGAMQFVETRPWIPSIGVTYHLGADGLSLPLVLLTTLLTLLCVIYSWRVDARPKEYMILFLLLETGMLGVFLALDFFLFYVFWEISLVPMYFIIGIWGGPRRAYAAIKFFLYTLLGSLAMLLAILILYFNATPRTFDILALIQQQPLSRNLSLGILAFWGFFLSFAIKVPMFPFHTWLPDAHVEAPTAGSVLLAAVLLKLGTYGFVRIALPLLPEAFARLAGVVAVLAVIGAVYGALVAMAQTDLKKLVAYSSVNHMGYVMLGVAAAAAAAGHSELAGAAATALNGATIQMLAHGVITGALFFLVGVIYDYRTHTRGVDDFGGLGARLPVYTGVTMLAMLASLGLPGLMGFVAEFLIFLGAFQIYPTLTVLALVGVVVTVAYFLWAIQRIFFGPLNARWAALPDLDARERWALVPLVAVMVFVGVYPRPLVDAVNLAMVAILGLTR